MEAYLMEVSEIQSELTRIWDSLEGTNKMRACLFNLILFTHKNERAGYIRTITQKVIERFPSRVIFITVDKKDSGDTLKASASVMTGAQGEYDIICDLIEIEIADNGQKRIPFAILPHILPDLPIYLLWAEDPSEENPLSYQLEKLATRIIFDSEAASDLSKFAQALLKTQRQCGCDVADLNWARTENWRELLSSTFHSQERLKQLKRTKSIQITYNSYETKFFCHTQIQAIYLQGWLASQLNWRLRSATKDQLRYQDVTVDLTTNTNPQLPPGTVISFDLETSDGEKFSFCRGKESPHQINMIISTPEKCDIPSKFIFTKSQSGLSLVNEICHSGTSEHYQKLLQFLC